MSFDVITTRGADAERWASLVGRLPAERRDIHFLPEYGRIYEDVHGYEAMLAFYEVSDQIIIKPFVRRPLSGLPFLQGFTDNSLFSDIANAYGFGGPIASNVQGCTNIVSNFSQAFASWCEEKGIASEFTCLHPFLESWQRPLLPNTETVKHEKDIVFIDLRQTESEMAAGLRKGHKSSIKRAERSNVEVRAVDPFGPDMAVFCEMYRETMLRLGAAARWLLEPIFFETTVRRLGQHRVSLIMATIDGRPESACILMHGYDTAYYHFAATFARRPDIGANNLMVFEAAKLMKSLGMRRLHLGGGVSSSPDDSLFKFKAGFSGARAPLYTSFAVRAPKMYDELCARKRAFERQTSGVEILSDFVPIYRR